MGFGGRGGRIVGGAPIGGRTSPDDETLSVVVVGMIGFCKGILAGMGGGGGITSACDPAGEPKAFQWSS
jgi:hypothetical protein